MRGIDAATTSLPFESFIATASTGEIARVRAAEGSSPTSIHCAGVSAPVNEGNQMKRHIVDVSPAAVLKRAMGTMRGKELARRTGVTPKHVSELLNGKARISHGYALRLERALGAPSRIFTNAQMWADLKKVRARAAAEEEARA